MNIKRIGSIISFVLVINCLTCCREETRIIHKGKARGQNVIQVKTQQVGWLEYVRLYPGEFLTKSKLDTGAKTSSINTVDSEIFNKEGKKWVRFTVMNKIGRKKSFEKQVIRFSKIKEHDHKPQIRPVVKLGILLGKNYCETEINLVDRRKFIYPLLLGRTYLIDANLMVNPSKKYTCEPDKKYKAELDKKE